VPNAHPDPDPKRLVADGYDRIAEAHAAWAATVRTDERARYAERLVSAFPRGAQLLELGCGTGGATSRSLAEHFELTGVDISRRSIELARSAVPNARFIVGDMTRVDFPDASFDAVAAFFSIIHVPRDEHGPLFARIRRWLRPTGLFVGALGLSDNPAGYESDWLGAPMFWSGFEPHVSERLIAAAGLTLESAKVETAEEDGEPVSFLWVQARRL
jgi:ubiquinone/menaquinone biosynthesis C-methylase UbiE